MPFVETEILQQVGAERDVPAETIHRQQILLHPLDVIAIDHVSGNADIVTTTDVEDRIQGK